MGVLNAAPEWIDLGRSIAAALGAAVAGALAAWVALGRARAQVASSDAQVASSDERVSEAQAHSSMLTLSTAREAETWNELKKQVRTLNAMKAAAARTEALLQNCESARVELRLAFDSHRAETSLQVRELRTQVYSLSARLREAGGSLTATDIGVRPSQREGG